MAKDTKYYYFRINLAGQPYAVKVSVIPIDTAIMRNFSAMSDEQVAFYLAHPDASIAEIVACELVPPYVPPTPELSDYIERKVAELKDACYGAVTVTSLQYAMAEDKTNNITADSFYSLTEARKILNDFRAESKKAMTVFSTYKPQIESAQTIEAVDTIYQQAIEEL